MANDIQQFVQFDPARIKFIARDRVLFKRLPTPDQVGSLYIPQTSRYVDRNDVAEVVKVGSGVTEVKPGDRLVLPDMLEVRGKFSHEGDTYTFIDREQLAGLAVLESY